MITGPTESIRLFIERGLNKGDLKVVEQIFSPHCIRYGITTGVVECMGIEQHKAQIATLRQAFPDLKVTLEETINAGAKAVCRLTFSGTQRGPWLGVPPTGRYANWGAIAIFRIVANKIQECWMAEDIYGALVQLHAVPDLAKAA